MVILTRTVARYLRQYADDWQAKLVQLLDELSLGILPAVIRTYAVPRQMDLFLQ
jgi:hypothetical protein